MLIRLFVLAWSAVALWAQALSPARQQEFEKLISQEMSRQNIPGLSAAVASGGEIAWSAGFGLSDVENFVPAKAATVYRLGSVSKPITAVALLQLWEAGKIDLDAPIQRYVPSFPHKPWPVTVRELLGHLGGIRHYDGQPEINSTRHYPELAAALRIFQDSPLAAEPGTRFLYTTYGYVLLGVAIESASQMRFMDYLRARIFGPAGMDRARQDHVYAIIPNRARGYALSSTGQVQNCSLADTSNKIPGGGLAATAEDLVKFGLAVRSAKLLKSSTLDMMFTSQKTRDGKPTDYGMGWNISATNRRKVVSHTGGQQGVSTILVMVPRDGIVVALMCNLERASLRELAQKIAQSLVTEPISRAKQ